MLSKEQNGSRRCRLIMLHRLASRTVWLVVAATLLVAGAWTSMAAAAQRDVIALPLAGNKIRHGARLEIETRWPLGSGYRPVKVTVVNMPAGKTKFDRDFRVC